jgi:hypothetical protein
MLRGVYPERLDLRSSTGLAEGLKMTMADVGEIVGQPLSMGQILDGDGSELEIFEEFGLKSETKSL